MDRSHLALWFGALVCLIVLSGFFSAAETALMAINRYRLRHQARQKKRIAMLILHLLRRPDRVLGLILIGNCFCNIMASALATLLAINLLGEHGVVISTACLTLAVLVLAEVAPKTVAALYPEQVARWVAWPVFILLQTFYPVVWLVNALSNGLLRLFRIRVTATRPETLNREELRSIVYETGGRMPRDYQEMLLGILDLNKVTVNDIMVPKHRIIGIDLNNDEKKTLQIVAESTHDWLPVYRDGINQVSGVLHLRELMPVVVAGQPCTTSLIESLLKEPYFVPENTPLNIQLLNFRRQQRRLALVVDEYGDIVGLVTLADILEEIVGDFAIDLSGTTRLIQRQGDGSYLVDGSLSLKEFNRLTGWELPAKGPRTLGGLVVEYLEAMPRAGTCVMIRRYPIEVVYVQDNRVRVARVFPERQA